MFRARLILMVAQGRIEREIIARGVFTSVKDLSGKLMRYIRAYSKTARPFQWKYAHPTACIRAY